MNIINKEKILEQARQFADEGKYDKAIHEYEKILLADPADLRIKLRVAELFTKRKQINEAIRIYREVADAYAQEGFFLKAVTVHKNILRLNPSLTEINEQLASLYEKMGLVPDAIRQYDILASALDLKGLSDRVLEIRGKIVKLNPKDGAARVRLAELYQRRGDIEAAIDQYEEYAKQIDASGKDKAKLADVFEKILAYRPNRDEMLRKLIKIYDELGDNKKALKWLESGHDVIEEDPDLLKKMAKIYASQNQNETARTKYLLLADLCKENGDVEGALDALCEILVILPDEEERIGKKIEEIKKGALEEISLRAQKMRKDLEQAAEDAETSDEDQVKEVTADINVKELEKKAAAHAVAKEKVPAKRPFNRREADAAFDLGMVYHKMGLADEARTEFEKAKNIYDIFIEDGGKDPIVSSRLEQIKEILKLS